MELLRDTTPGPSLAKLRGEMLDHRSECRSYISHEDRASSLYPPEHISIEGEVRVVLKSLNVYIYIYNIQYTIYT